MILTKNKLLKWAYPASLIGILLLLKQSIDQLSVSSLDFLLYPTQFLTSIFTGLTFKWVEQSGYINDISNIIINAQCSGASFLIIVYLVNATVLFALPLNRQIQWTPLFLIAGYVLTLLANTSRIVSSIAMENIPALSATAVSAHKIIGTLIFITFLIGYYYLISYYLIPGIRKNEKYS